jgi:hypothetical protein
MQNDRFVFTLGAIFPSFHLLLPSTHGGIKSMAGSTQQAFIAPV